MTYNQVMVREDLGFTDYTLTGETVKKYAEAIDGFHPWYLEGSPFGGKIVHPTTAALY